MKKILLSIILMFYAVVYLSAGLNELAAFPQGVWEDVENDARWVFLPNNIQIRQEGEVVFEFKDKIEDLDIKISPKRIEMTFRCDETGKDYFFYKDRRSTDLNMSISKDSGLRFEVRMRKK